MHYIRHTASAISYSFYSRIKKTWALNIDVFPKRMGQFMDIFSKNYCYVRAQNISYTRVKSRDKTVPTEYRNSNYCFRHKEMYEETDLGVDERLQLKQTLQLFHSTCSAWALYLKFFCLCVSHGVIQRGPACIFSAKLSVVIADLD